MLPANVRMTAGALLLLLLLSAGCEKIRPLLDGQVQVHHLRATAMNKVVPALIVLPRGYWAKENAAHHYPVVYLLHGYSGNYRQWQEIADLPALASRYNTILVCPDGGYDSWYLDSPVADSSRYESFIMKDVLALVDTTYRTAGAAGRAVTGLSMGGHGALRFLALYPDSFAAAGSMSGILDLRPFPASWNLAGRLGEFSQFPQRWAENSDVLLVRKLAGRGKSIIVDCGVEDFALAVNRAFRDSSAVHRVPITYVEGPGKHSRDYWAERIEPHLQFFQRVFAK